MNVLTKVLPGSSPNSSFSSARRYFARIFVAVSTSAMSIFWRMRASRSLSPIACTAAYSGERKATRPVASAPPAGLHFSVLARRLPGVGRPEHDVLEPLAPRLVASPRAGRDAHRVPLRELDDLVVELHPAAPAQDHVDLLLPPVRVAVREAIAGRDALVTQAGLLELERLGRQ